MDELALASVERIIKNAGAERVGMDAIVAITEILEEICSDVSKYSVKLVKHAKRTTVKKEDVKLAARKRT
ncbi:MAG TPA: histone [Thermoplasmata archaeon]|jgi:DNA-binding protein|nr:MAG TPA: histone [Thermoplasmata archaeon]